MSWACTVGSLLLRPRRGSSCSLYTTGDLGAQMMTLMEASVIQPHRPTDGTSIWSISNNEKNSGKERPSPNECKTRHYYITAVRTAVRSDCPFLNEMNPTTRQEERASDEQLPTHFAATATQTPKARTTPRNFNCTRITQIQFVLTNLTTKNGRSGLCLQGAFMKFRKPSDSHGVMGSWCQAQM